MISATGNNNEIKIFSIKRKKWIRREKTNQELVDAGGWPAGRGGWYLQEVAFGGAALHAATPGPWLTKSCLARRFPSGPVPLCLTPCPFPPLPPKLFRALTSHSLSVILATAHVG